MLTGQVTEEAYVIRVGWHRQTDLHEPRGAEAATGLVKAAATTTTATAAERNGWQNEQLTGLHQLRLMAI